MKRADHQIGLLSSEGDRIVAVDVGDVAPDFTLETSSRTRNTSLRLSSLRGQKVVLFFYPADHSPGCTTQVCSFRDAYDELVGHGVAVVGISGQTIASHERFAGSHALPFPIASDPGNRVRREYGASKWILPWRVTYLIDEDGVVVDVYSGMVRPLMHVERVKEWIAGAVG
ncbi:MAG: peroxiredoxin [Gammaproteobacteria bacterium]|nr:peroxiredoxin [Gammaproteobacteria bacterium]